MTEVLLFVSTGSLLVVGVATLVIAGLALRDARRYVERAEDRMDNLRETQARLLIFLREERQSPKEEPEQEPHSEAQRRAEQLSRELEQERRARRDAERRIDQLKRELQEFREVRQKSSSTVLEGLSESRPGAREVLKEKTVPTQKAQGAGKTPRPASFLETASSKPEEIPPEDKRSRRGVWMSHPDDDVVSRGRAPAGQTHAQSEAPVKMFRKHYDKYLENYRGYVELAEGLYRTRENGEAPPGSLAEREWEKRLRRVNDGMARTTARLDILEEHNPELATDDRVSRRASLARRLSDLEGEAGGAV
jgi:hypothetical protein